MVNIEKPKISLLISGEMYKVYEVTGRAGMVMPKHYSTKEAVIIIKEGSALLELLGEKNL